MSKKIQQKTPQKNQKKNQQKSTQPVQQKTSKKAHKLSHNKNVLRFFLFLTLALMVFGAIAVFTTPAKAWTSEDQEYSEKARGRHYVGGADEADLKVLPTLPVIKNKKANVDESSEGF